MLKPTALLPLVLLGAGLALAQPAAATDYCVDVAMTCDAANDLGNFETALDKADDSANADRIFLGAGTYTAPDAAGFNYQSGPVEVIGKGQGTTILTGSYPASQRVLRLMGGAGTSIHDLTVRMPPGVTLAHEALATDGVARRIQVTEDPGQLASHVGVVLKNGGVLEDAVVQLGTDLETTGVVFDAGGGTVRDSIVIGRTAVESREGGTLERVRARGFNNGVIAEGNVTTIRSSLIRVTGPIATGISALQKPGYNSQVHLDGVAVDGPGGGPGTTGVFAGNLLDPNHSVNVTIKNSIIRGFDKALNFLGFGGSGLVHATSSYSDYDVAKAKFSGTGAGITQTNITNVGDAGFANPATGNYHLLPGSALIDAGDPATPQGLDLDKKALVADGNADGKARRDVGPFELPAPPSPTPPAPPPPNVEGGTAPAASTGPTTGAGDTQPPLITGFRTTRKVFAAGRARTAVSARVRGTRFRYTLSEDAKVTVRIVRRNGRSAGKLMRTAKKGANTVKFSGRIGRRALKRGRYRAVIVATDAAGNRSAPRRVKFRVV
jgi:hypothetical protein